jgi:hypothetical protein
LPIFFGFHIWERAHGTCLSVSGLFHTHTHTHTHTQKDNVFQFHSFCCNWQDFILLCGWIIFHCVYMSHFLYPFNHWWIPELIPYLSYCEQCWNGHGCVDVSSVCWFHFLWLCTQEVGIRSHGRTILIFWGTSILYITVVVFIYIPANRTWVVFFLHVLTNIDLWFLFLVVSSSICVSKWTDM